MFIYGLIYQQIPFVDNYFEITNPYHREINRTFSTRLLNIKFVIQQRGDKTKRS